jgi:anaerobic selenocysteine-containing dehydrogenase
LVPLRHDVALAAEGTPVQIHAVGPESGGSATPGGSATFEPDRPDEVTAPVAEGLEADEEPAVAANPTPAVQPMTWQRPSRYDTPARDSYSLRLLATRKLYDRGTLLQHAPSLAGLAPGTELRVSASDLERLGVSHGGRVKVSSSRGSLTLDARADPSLPKGTAQLYVNQPGPDPAVLIDAAAPVTDIRIESGS